MDVGESLNTIYCNLMTENHNMGANSGPLPIERRAIAWLQERLPRWAAEIAVLVFKQLSACLFGASILALLIATSLVWQPDWAIARYDFLVVAAIGVQGIFIVCRLETLDEAKVILFFHITGMIMEIFKVSAGSWSYPEPGVLKVADVPLFTGFMYASVGSYFSRSMRLFQARFERYPTEWMTWALAAAIYVNFYSHHFIWDARCVLMIATLVLFGRTLIAGRNADFSFRVPMVGLILFATFLLFIAENVGTHTGTWTYGQGTKVALAKAGSWYLLLYVAFVQVALVHRRRLIHRNPATQRLQNEGKSP